MRLSKIYIYIYIILYTRGYKMLHDTILRCRGAAAGKRIRRPQCVCVCVCVCVRALVTGEGASLPSAKTRLFLAPFRVTA